MNTTLLVNPSWTQPEQRKRQGAAALRAMAEAAGASLEVLRIDSCRVGEDDLRAIAARCPRLRTLAVAGCRGVTDAGLQYIVGGCVGCAAC